MARAVAVTKPLIISEQPPSLFWKDRGGKRNMLRVVIESPIPLRQPLPLRIMLFNDAGEAVEEVSNHKMDFALSYVGDFTTPVYI